MVLDHQQNFFFYYKVAKNYQSENRTLKKLLTLKDVHLEFYWFVYTILKFIL